MNKPKIGKNTKQTQQVFTQAHFHIIIFFCEFVSRPLHIYTYTPCVTFLQPIIRLVPRPCHTQHAQYSVTAADAANKSHTAAGHPKLRLLCGPPVLLQHFLSRHGCCTSVGYAAANQCLPLPAVTEVRSTTPRYKHIKLQRQRVSGLCSQHRIQFTV